MFSRIGRNRSTSFASVRRRLDTGRYLASPSPTIDRQRPSGSGTGTRRSRAATVAAVEPELVGRDRENGNRPSAAEARALGERPPTLVNPGGQVHSPAGSAPPGASASARERDVPPSSVARPSPPQAPPENLLARRNRPAAVQQALPLLPLPLDVAPLVPGPQAGEDPGEEDAGEQCKGKQDRGTHGTGAYQNQTRSPTPDLRHL